MRKCCKARLGNNPCRGWEIFTICDFHYFKFYNTLFHCKESHMQKRIRYPCSYRYHGSTRRLLYKLILTCCWRKNKFKIELLIYLKHSKRQIKILTRTYSKAKPFIFITVSVLHGCSINCIQQPIR